MNEQKGIKKGSQVIVITGSNKGKQGKVLAINRKKNRVVIENIAMIKKHQKPIEGKVEGGVIEREGSIHRSNVMLLEKFNLKKAKE